MPTLRRCSCWACCCSCSAPTRCCAVSPASASGSDCRPSRRACCWLASRARCRTWRSMPSRFHAGRRRELALGNAVGGNIANIGLMLGARRAGRALAGDHAPARGARAVRAGRRRAGADVRPRWRHRALGRRLLFSAFFACLALPVPARPAGERRRCRPNCRFRRDLHRSRCRTWSASPSPAALLYFGSRWVVQGAPVLGLALGLGPTGTGLTLVAVGTALPKLVLAAMAATRGQGNIVAGQVLGACLFNLLFMLGVMALLRPLPLPASFVSFELPAAMAFALLALSLARRRPADGPGARAAGCCSRSRPGSVSNCSSPCVETRCGPPVTRVLVLGLSGQVGEALRPPCSRASARSTRCPARRVRPSRACDGCRARWRRCRSPLHRDTN